MKVNQFMNRFGRSVCIKDDDGWNSETFHAFIQPLRYKNKMYLYGVNTTIGFNSQGHYLYIGPPEHDLTLHEDSYFIESNGEKYKVDRAERVYAGDKIFYVWAIIRTIIDTG